MLTMLTDETALVEGDIMSSVNTGNSLPDLAIRLVGGHSQEPPGVLGSGEATTPPWSSMSTFAMKYLFIVTRSSSLKGTWDRRQRRGRRR